MQPHEHDRDSASRDDVATSLCLNRTNATDYCTASLRTRHNEFWWYLKGLAPFRGFSRPFCDADGRWWYRLKPAFGMPVDFFTTFARPPRGMWKRPLMGWQWPVEPSIANSALWMNVIHDLKGYSIDSVASNKRRAIRKGMRGLRIIAVDPAAARVVEDACDVWNSHVQRTGWNNRMDVPEFADSWRELADWPGTTVLAAIDSARNDQICAWLIARVIDDIVYIDTLASHTDRLEQRPNDTIVFTCLITAATLGVRRAYYSLKSSITSLEAFKESLGFSAHAFPARLHLRPMLRTALRLVQPRIYRRLLGDPDWDRDPQSRK